MFEGLLEQGSLEWSDSSLALLAGGNLLRVMRQVEAGAGGQQEGGQQWLEHSNEF